uniref:Ig-like domain-containing protein n=1 Tax=Seriola lalandi dorsalis TaxID=1841481 RepID=A0A3B4XDC7_SERLL
MEYFLLLLLSNIKYKPPSLPSVSLLQKTPSSPVSCHATGFYPHRAVMFWRKDGEDLHEDMDQGEILPNHDETFQMRVDLDISSVTPEDWRRYDCVFQLSGVKEDVVTKLDKAEIRTNWGKIGVRKDQGSKHFIFLCLFSFLRLFFLSLFGFTIKLRLEAAEWMQGSKM